MTTTIAAPTPQRSQGSRTAPVPDDRRPGVPPAGGWDPVSFRAASTADGPQDPAAQPDDLACLPAPGPWAGALVRAAVEVLTGSRPPAQLARWLSLDLYESIVRRAGLAVRILGRPEPARGAQLRRVRCATVRPGVHEVAVVVHDGVRVRAAAVRIEALRGRWRATALEIG